MLKVKKEDTKKKSPFFGKSKDPKIVQSPSKQAKEWKKEKGDKVVKQAEEIEVLEGELFTPSEVTKVPKEQVIAAQKEKQKQKKLQKKNKKKGASPENGKKKGETTAAATPKSPGKVKSKPKVAPKVAAVTAKKVLSEEEIAAKKEKQKQKKLAQKNKKLLAKKVENGDKAPAAPDSSKEAGENKPKPQENGTKAKTPAAIVKQKAKKDKKKLKKLTDGETKTTAPVGTPEQTIFIGNLPTNTKRVQLIKLFSAYGMPLSIRLRSANGKVIFKHKMRKEAGSLIAYMVLKDADTAAKALEMNGTEFKGHHIRVNKSDKPEEETDTKRLVLVGNLKYSATDDKLHQIFSSCGEIEYVRTVQNPEKSGCKGIAFVCFKNADSVGLALELKGTILDERPIHVERYSVNKLGAKSKRDAEAVNKPQKGKQVGKGKKPQPGKKFEKGKKPGKGNKPGKANASAKESSDGDEAKTKKKSEFRGVKTDVNKKKQKKKLPTEMRKLAKKIAPKSDD